MFFLCDHHYKFGYYKCLESMLKPAADANLMTSTNSSSFSTAHGAQSSTQAPNPNQEGGIPDKTFAVLVFVAAVFVFVMGQFVDSLRDILETFSDFLLERLWKDDPKKTRLSRFLRRWLVCGVIDWKKIAKMDKNEREPWDDYFLGYFIFCANMVIVVFLLLAVCLLCLLFGHHRWWVALICIVGMTAVFVVEAVILRRDVIAILVESKPASEHQAPRKDN
jgi:hypothetical protein